MEFLTGMMVGLLLLRIYYVNVFVHSPFDMSAAVLLSTAMDAVPF